MLRLSAAALQMNAALQLRASLSIFLLPHATLNKKWHLIKQVCYQLSDTKKFYSGQCLKLRYMYNVYNPGYLVTMPNQKRKIIFHESNLFFSRKY